MAGKPATHHRRDGEGAIPTPCKLPNLEEACAKPHFVLPQVNMMYFAQLQSFHHSLLQGDNELVYTQSTKERGGKKTRISVCFKYLLFLTDKVTQ